MLKKLKTNGISRTVYPMIILFIILPGCLTAIKNTAQYGAPALKIATSTANAARPISPGEEYYLGRTVAANFLKIYPLSEDASKVEYVSLVGHTLAMHSDAPVIFGGYHFAVLDTEEPNAFACPGGIIFISTGLLDVIHTEDELAAVLAHEISHIYFRDGVSAIKSAKWTEALSIIGTVVAGEYGSQELGQLVNLFEGSVEDIMETLIINGYSRKQEIRADQAALPLLKKAGYDPAALYDVIVRLSENTPVKPDKGIMNTHPVDSKRISMIKNELSEMTTGMDNKTEKRKRRFYQYLGAR